MPGVRSSPHIIGLDFTCLRVSEKIFRNPETSKIWPDFLPAANFGNSEVKKAFKLNVAWNRAQHFLQLRVTEKNNVFKF